MPQLAGQTGRETAASPIYTDGTYLSKNCTWHAEDSPWKAGKVQAMLAKHQIRPTRVCEVGCGAGEILRQLSTAMPETEFHGYEVSPQAFELCKSRESGNVRYHLKDFLEEDSFFDCLLCIDVFEHVEDYMGLIRSLKPRSTYKVFHIPLDVSVLALFTGSMMDMRASVGHLHYFTRESALATLTDCGYEIVDSAYTSGFLDLPSRTLKGKLAKPVFRVLFSIAPHSAVQILGLSSLLVLAR